MPIIRFTAGDTLKNQIISDNAWYGLDILKAENPFTSKTGSGSLNYKITFGIREGKFQGKELEIIYNTNMNQGSVLGGAQFEPDWKMLDLIAAITGQPNEVGKEVEFDISDFAGKSIDGRISAHSTAEGGLTNIITQFAPLGQGTRSQQEKTPF